MPGANPYFYFQPNSLGMRVTHPGDTLSPDPLPDFWDWIKTEATNLFGTSVDIPKPPDNVQRHFTFAVKGFHGSNLTYAFRDINGLKVEQLPKLVEHCNTSPQKPTCDSAALDMIDLNWLACGSGNGNFPGDGGPGGPPYPFPPEGETLIEPIQYHFQGSLLNALNAVNGDGKNISVVILDTSPDKDDLTKAYGKWVTNLVPGQLQPHPILKRLWSPDGLNTRLKIETMKPATRQRLKTYSIFEHQYSISDHGLFIAGIIDTLAPEADLYLYEALNDRGVCDSESILAGLSWIADNLKEARIVINCSLFVLIPYDAKHFREDLPKNMPKEKTWTDPKDLETWFRKQAKFNEPTFQLFHTRDAAVVAAAGNDWHHGGQNQDRPDPRYPAAFDSVFGVGALEDPAQHVPAAYSNKPDDPESVGVSAFGGGLNDGQGQARQGMIGVYINPDFPDTKKVGQKPDNHYGWARWAGTSFATPLVSGMAAALMSSALDPKITDGPANIIKAFANDSNPEGEKRLEIIQG